MVAVADEKQGDGKLELIRQISGLADEITQKYVESLSETINDPEATDEEKSNAFGEMDKVLRVAKQYADREGTRTLNLRIDSWDKQEIYSSPAIKTTYRHYR